MQATSHFIGLELKPEYFSDIYVKLYEYLKNNGIENIITFQNILSVHITLYYLGKELTQEKLYKIQQIIDDIQSNIIIVPGEFSYFQKDNNKVIGYIYGKSNIDLDGIFNKFHSELNEEETYENNLSFVPHITVFKINDFDKFELHRNDIENIVNQELEKINDINLTTNQISIYKVNSKFPGEIQIKLF